MEAVDIIRKKRDGETLSDEEITFMVQGTLDERVADYQMGAFLMAVFMNSLNDEETFYFTRAIIESGEQLQFDDKLLVSDKHSTGGIGDKTSFFIAPVCADCGLHIPMISGRALGFTGGTLDKLESIPGMDVSLSREKFEQGVARLGCVISGQTASLAASDRKIYMMRDFTSTVESEPLISASIMGKKMAAGVNYLVLDVKVGSGAFMKAEEPARSLSRRMMDIGRRLGRRVGVVLSRMEAPLGHEVGNANEIEESIKLMDASVYQDRSGDSSEAIIKAALSAAEYDLYDLSARLSAVLLQLAGIEKDMPAALERVHQSVLSGRALKKFEEMVAFQGGDLAAFKTRREQARFDYSHKTLVYQNDGRLRFHSGAAIGRALAFLEGGRFKAGEQIDHQVSLTFHHNRGEVVKKGEAAVTIMYHPDLAADRLKEAVELLQNNFDVADVAELDGLIIDTLLP